jgi:hypothetical protein
MSQALVCYNLGDRRLYDSVDEFGLGLVLKYIRDFEISRKILINSRVDNRSVIAWLTRSEQRHWRKIKGINQKITEKTLDNIATFDCWIPGRCKTCVMCVNLPSNHKAPSGEILSGVSCI